MRILFTFAHYFDPKGGGRYGSLKAAAAPRRAALAGAIFGLHASFGRRQGLQNKPITACNARFAADIEVVVCTTGERHLVGALGALQDLFTHERTAAEPRYLGFECHEVLRRALGRFDYYCYLEDDIALADPLFFHKLEWFNRLAGDDAVLQPNRFELALETPWHKLFVDGALAKPEASERWQDAQDRHALEGEALGARLRFVRVGNPHSGCFFLNARQMAHWARQEDFGLREARWVGALESAATYGVMRHFRAYKPAQENAAFLEVRHLDNRYLGVRVGARAARAGAGGAP